MSPQEALRILDQVTSQINTSREGHIKIQEAIAVLSKLIIDKEK